jgi:GNAT superfamily N-acetyltransferase
MPGDIPAIVAMVNDRRSEGHVFPASTRVDRTNAMRDIIGILVAEIEGRIVGCVNVDVTRDPAHFGMLATEPSLQRTGVGSMLIEHVEAAARAAGREVMAIEVVLEAGRVPFYERRGYVVVRQHDGPAWNGGKDWGATLPWHMVEMEKRLR